LELDVPGANVNGIGSLSLDSLYLESLVNAHITSTKVIDSLIILPIQFDSVNTVTSITGPVNQLEIGGEVDVYNANGYSAETERADANYVVSILPDSLNVWVNVIASSVQTGPTFWDSTIVDFNYNDAGIDIDANVIWTDTINARILTHINLGDTLSFEIPRFEAKTLLSSYYLTDTVHALMSSYETIEIDNFRLRDYNRENFVFAAHGAISSTDTNSMKIELKEFDMIQLNRLLKTQDSIKGTLETDIIISGTSHDPSIIGSVEISNPQFGKYKQSSLLSKFNYTDQNGYAELTAPDMGNSFHANISVPFKAYFDSLKFIYDSPEFFNANLIIDSLPISKIANQFTDADSISGLLNGKIEANGELENPQFFGELDLTNGNFIDKTLGIDYKQIHTSLVLDGNKILMDTVLVRQKDGVMSLFGNIEFDSTLIKGNIKSSSLQLDANSFFITKHRNYEILIDANSYITTDSQKPEFGSAILTFAKIES